MTWLVTGASSGVGRVLAVALAGAGHRVILTGRNDRLLADSQMWCPGSVVLPADLADPASVEALAVSVRSLLGGEGLAGIVHAAGVMHWNSPAAGVYSLVAQVNAVAPWRLTLALEPQLLAAEHARVLFVAGAPMTFQGLRPDLAHWMGGQPGRGLSLALEAAAAKVFMARELHRRWKGRASAFAFHPGFIKSNLADGLPFPLRTLGCLAQPFLATRCRNGEYLALEGGALQWSGQLVANRRGFPDSPVPEDGPKEALWLDSLSRS